MIKKGKLYFIINSSTEESIRDLKELFDSGKVKKDMLRHAQLHYNPSMQMPRKSGPYYPLTLKGKDVVIRVSCVSTGYKGVGPNGAIQALRLAGFKVPEQGEKLIYTKENINLYFWKEEIEA